LWSRTFFFTPFSAPGGQSRIAHDIFGYPIPVALLLLVSAAILIWIWREALWLQRIIAIVTLATLSFTLPAAVPILWLLAACSFTYCDL
jgi:hypothetical protein